MQAMPHELTSQVCICPRQPRAAQVQFSDAIPCGTNTSIAQRRITISADASMNFHNHILIADSDDALPICRQHFPNVLH